MYREKKCIVMTVFAIIFALSFLTWAGVRIVKAHQFGVNCKQYIKRAADASTIELAKEELGKAMSYAEEKNLTSGIVSIFLRQPKNDISYWYRNMKDAYSELDALPAEATPLEKTNVLMKLRESLTDEKDGDLSVTVPDGISIYPYNVLYFVWALLSILFALMFGILAAYYFYY